MKKIFLSVLTLALSVNLFAINYSGKVTVAIFDGSHIHNATITESSDVPEGQLLNGYYTPVQDLNSLSVAAYVPFNNVAYESIVLHSLTNTPLVIKASTVTNYSLYFTNLEGSISLYDTKVGQFVDMTTNPYDFTIEDSERDANNIVANRFVINYLPVSIKGTGVWWGLGKDVDLAIAADGKTATGSLTFDAAGTYNFKVVRGSDWLSDVTEFTRNDNERAITATQDGGMWFTIDAIGASNEYAFTWTFATNTLTIDFPAAPAPACETVRTGLTVDNYYTICLPKAVTAANGASFWNMSNRGEGVAYLVEAELPLVAGRPYVIQAEADELCVEYSGDPEAASAFGALHGTFAAMDQDALTAAGTDIYLLKNNELWLVSGQTGNSLAANRAYVKYSELIPENPQPAPGRRVRAIPMQPNVATGIDAINANEAPAKTMIDGKLYIIRGEHMFDATGRMVK